MRTQGVFTIGGILTIALNLGVVQAAPRGGRPVAFVGACRTTFSPPQPTSTGQLEFIVNGTCEIGRLGAATVYIDQFATFHPDGTSVSEATITYTFANGDQLVAHSVAEGGAPNEEGVFFFTATQSFTGGSGRFAHATGSTSWTLGVVDTFRLQGAFAFGGEVER